MIAKIIAQRADAHGCARASGAARSITTRVVGPRTNAAFLAALLRTRGVSHRTSSTPASLKAISPRWCPPREPDLAAAAAGLARSDRARAASALRHARGGDGACRRRGMRATAFSSAGTRVARSPILVDDERADGARSATGRMDLRCRSQASRRPTTRRWSRPAMPSMCCSGGRQTVVRPAHVAS